MKDVIDNLRIKIIQNDTINHFFTKGEKYIMSTEIRSFCDGCKCEVDWPPSCSVEIELKNGDRKRFIYCSNCYEEIKSVLENFNGKPIRVKKEWKFWI